MGTNRLAMPFALALAQASGFSWEHLRAYIGSRQFDSTSKICDCPPLLLKSRLSADIQTAKFGWQTGSASYYKRGA
jgi:hypothetical protein